MKLLHRCPVQPALPLAALALMTSVLLPASAVSAAGGAGSEPGTIQVAQATTEKDAFEAAKALGTVEAWDAFLSNFPTGFHADLARAYVKKLAEGAPDTRQTPPPPPPQTAVVYDYPMVAGTWGGIVRNGPGQGYNQVDSLSSGSMVTLMAPPLTMENGYPWFKIAYGNEREGFMWGGIICSTGAERQDMFKLCTFTPVNSAGNSSTPERKTSNSDSSTTKYKPKKVVCRSTSVLIDGRCVKKRDASTHCGPGYRLKGSKCVPGYQAPKASDPIPSWQLEAIKKGCPKGMGWNAAEGCHEND